jgi:hypothetical protein
MKNYIQFRKKFNIGKKVLIAFIDVDNNGHFLCEDIQKRVKFKYKSVFRNVTDDNYYIIVVKIKEKLLAQIDNEISAMHNKAMLLGYSKIELYKKMIEIQFSVK